MSYFSLILKRFIIDFDIINSLKTAKAYLVDRDILREDVQTIRVYYIFLHNKILTISFHKLYEG